MGVVSENLREAMEDPCPQFVDTFEVPLVIPRVDV